MARTPTLSSAYRSPQEWMAGLVVFCVALPLCIGISIASGVPIASGIVSGIVGGLVVGALAGSPLLVSGPAAALAPMVVVMVRDFGLEGLAVIGTLAGLFQILFGGLGLGRWFRAVSPPVIHGLLGGIGLLVISSQLLLGLGEPSQGHPGLDLAHGVLAVGSVVFGAASVDLQNRALLVAVTVLSIVLATRVSKKLPGPLVGVFVATALAHGLGLPYHSLELASDWYRELPHLSLGHAGLFFDPAIWRAALGLALVASAETLLCATAMDELHDGKATRYDQEIFAQGVGNLICGLLGALPSVGLIVRSTPNADFQARSRLPALLHGVLLFGFCLAFPWLLAWVPMEAFAGVLVHVGMKLALKVPLGRMAEYGRSEIRIYLLTLGGILGLGLLGGVALGLGLSLAKLLYTLTHLEIQAVEIDSELHLKLSGSATFVQIPTLADELDALPPERVVHLHLDHLDYIDHGCLELLSRWSQRYERLGGDVIVEWSELAGLYEIKNRRIDGKGSLSGPHTPISDAEAEDENSELAKLTPAGPGTSFESGISWISG